MQRTNGFAAGDGYTTDQTLPSLDRGNSTYDVRHRLTVSYTWELPFFLHHKGFAKAALAGWQMNGIWAFQRAPTGHLSTRAAWWIFRSLRQAPAKQAPLIPSNV